jgi:hypothetical protein
MLERPSSGKREFVRQAARLGTLQDPTTTDS